MKKLIIFTIIGLLLLSGCNSAPKETGGESHASSSNNEQLELDPAVSKNVPASATSDQQPQETPDVESDENETAPEADQRGVLGSHATDIRMGLTNFGLEEAAFSRAPEAAADIFAFTCSTFYTDETMGVSLDYSLTLDSEYQIISSTFGISNINCDAEIFIEYANLFLGYCATMPYDDADQAKAQQWVIDNIPLIDAENPVETTIGDASFELYVAEVNGYIGSIMLDIGKAEK